MESLPIGTPIQVTFYRCGEKKQTTFNYSPDTDPFKIKNLIEPYEKVKYSIVGGMVFTQLTDVTLTAALRVDPTLGSLYLPENRTKERLMLTHIFGHSQVFRNHTVGPGVIIRRVNGQEVHTIEDLNKIISTASTRKDFTFSFNHHRRAFLTPNELLDELFELENPNWDKGPDDDTGGDGPEVIPTIKLLEDEMYASQEGMSAWDKIKANQARKAMLVAKGIHTEDPITDITLRIQAKSC